MIFGAVGCYRQTMVTIPVRREFKQKSGLRLLPNISQGCWGILGRVPEIHFSSRVFSGFSGDGERPWHQHHPDNHVHLPKRGLYGPGIAGPGIAGCRLGSKEKWVGQVSNTKQRPWFSITVIKHHFAVLAKNRFWGAPCTNAQGSLSRISWNILGNLNHARPPCPGTGQQRTSDLGIRRVRAAWHWASANKV